MGTPAAIAVVVGNKLNCIYVHWDGFAEHLGKILLENYSGKSTTELVAQGDASVIDTTVIGSRFYHRDLGEDLTDVGFRAVDSPEDFLNEYDVSFYYLLDNTETWYIMGGYITSWTKLEDVLHK